MIFKKTLLCGMTFFSAVSAFGVAQRLSFAEIIAGVPVKTLAQAAALIPAADITEAERQVDETLAEAQLRKQSLLAVPAAERTYANTVLAYDHLMGILQMGEFGTRYISWVGADVERRGRPHSRMMAATVALVNDVAFYRAFCEYKLHGLPREVLTTEQARYFNEVMEGFKRQGFDKDSVTFVRITELMTEIERLKGLFEAHLDQSVTALAFYESELAGLSPLFIAAQERDVEGRVLIPCTQLSVDAVMPYSHNPLVRKALNTGMLRRAFPQNDVVFQELLLARHELANLLGYENYAAYQLGSYMMGKPSVARQFIDSIGAAARRVGNQELLRYREAAPAGAFLPGSVLQQWDVQYVVASYKQKCFDLDPRQVSEYFPVERTIQGVLAIYEQFMGVSFEYHNSVEGAWDQSVRGISVYTKDRAQLLGHVLLDLFPRSHKYSHASCYGFIPRARIVAANGMEYQTPYVCLLITNFPKPQPDNPGLLLHSQVITLFHEFGHAMHGMLACPAHLKTAGINVKLDFIELPSQVLELWMWDADMLRLVSSHYKTGQSLPESLITKMLAARRCGLGVSEMVQYFYGIFSLAYHEAVPPVDPFKILQRSFLHAMRGIEMNQENRQYANFWHLGAYGAAYYGYALARAYAYDIFSTIKAGGLLNETTGKRFVECVLRPGGSQDPLAMMHAFLGRPVSADAYVSWLADIGESA